MDMHVIIRRRLAVCAEHDMEVMFHASGMLIGVRRGGDMRGRYEGAGGMEWVLRGGGGGMDDALRDGLGGSYFHGEWK